MMPALAKAFRVRRLAFATFSRAAPAASAILEESA
jgi:hypothetical protein